MFKAIKDFSAYKKLPCNAIIKNPFGMTFARQWRKNRQAIFEEFGLGDPADKLFAYIGMLHPIKGTDLIIKAFSEAKFKKAKLLIVGAGNPLYAKHYRSLANDNGDTIVFLGRMEFQEVIKIYAVSDFVVRGDPDFRIGRTIYEALYAGCNLIIPGNINDLDLETGLQPFASRIFFYEHCTNLYCLGSFSDFMTSGIFSNVLMMERLRTIFKTTDRRLHNLPATYSNNP